MAIVLITGCSTGFGLATAIGFAQRGDSVVATSRDPDRSTRLREQARAHPNLSLLRLDVTDQTSIDAAVEQTRARLGAIGGILTTAFLGAYCASKHALDCLAAVYDLELRPFGIRVSSVYPSAFHTAMADKMVVVGEHDTPYAEATREYRDGLLDRITHGPSDLSPVVDAVIEAATSADPRLRYLVAPHLAEVLAPALQAQDALHQRELGLTPT